MIGGIFISFISGIFTGIITGLTPGIHINLIGTLLISTGVSNFLPKQNLLIYISALAITHTFLDFIPSIYLGAPSEDTAISTLIGHKFLLKGKGHAAVNLTNKGSLIATISLLVLYPALYFIIPKTYTLIEKLIPLILIWIIFLMIKSEKNNRKYTLVIIFLSGLLGISTLNSTINQPLLPLLTGLFSTSTLILSIKNKTKIPEQSKGTYLLKKKELIKPTILTMLISPIFSLLPGLGSSQAAIISQKLIKEKSKKQHLILLGSINTIVVSISFLTLYLLNKARTGIASTIKELTSLNLENLAIILITLVFSGIIAYIITNLLSKRISQKIENINYSKISIIVMILTTTIIILVCKLTGLIILISATTLGILCSELNQRKSILMTSIMIPTIYLLI